MNARLQSPRYFVPLAGLALILALALAGIVGGSDRRPDTAGLEEDFSNPSQTWDPLDDNFVTAAFERGRYEVTLKEPDYTFVDEAIWSGALEFESVEVRATVTMVDEGAGRFGILCYSNPGTEDSPGGVFARYEFFITSEGGYGIAKWLNGTSEILELREQGPIDTGEENEIVARCRGGESAELAMSVNGEPLVDVTDSSGLESFEGTGVLAGSEKTPGLAVAFDDISAGPTD